MFEKPILIYSDYCVYSKNFLQTLMKYPDLYNSFIRMNIDVDAKTKQRPKSFYQIQQILDVKITKVPTVVTPNAQYILSDVEAFKWLEYQVKLLTDTSGELQPFNPNEMGSFSDNYANYGSTDLCDAKEQTFKFFQNGQLTDDNYLNTNKTWDPKTGKTNGFLNDLESSAPKMDYASKKNEREYFDNIRQKSGKQEQGQINVREQYIQNNQTSGFVQRRETFNNQRQSMPGNINFTDPNFGLSGQMGNNNRGVSEKSKELDSKLQQLMNDREQVDVALNQRPRFY